MNDTAFSSIDFVGQCLIDEERTTAFKKAIRSVVKPEHVVLDVGTGSGVMSLLAAKCSPRMVHAIEYDPYIADVAKHNIATNEMKNIAVHIADARRIEFLPSDFFDVVIMEMITTGMVDEFQVQAINNLHKQNVVNGRTTFIPCRQDTYVTLAGADLKHYGLKFSMVKHLWKWHDWSGLNISKLTDRVQLSSISFHCLTTEAVDATLTFIPLESGKINALILSSESFLTSKIMIADTESMNAPVLVPVPECVVQVGKPVKLRINYQYGGGYRTFKANII